MRLYGYCTGCRRVRRIRVTAHALALAAVGGRLEGVCDECENPQPKKEATP